MPQGSAAPHRSSSRPSLSTPRARRLNFLSAPLNFLSAGRRGRQPAVGQAGAPLDEEAIARLRAQSGGELGPIYEDGGVPVLGLARALAGEKWNDVVREHFLTSDKS